MILRGRLLFGFRICLLTVFLCVSAALHAAEFWDQPAFSFSPGSLQQQASLVKPEKDTAATILLRDQRYEYDSEGKVVATYHTIYRIENEDGVNGWATTTADWEPWHQAKPEIRARVISADGSVHELDPKTLNDVPAHENAPDLFSDERAFGGPLPAIAVGAIVEEQIVIRDTARFFAAGQVDRHVLSRSVPVNQTRFVLVHPLSLPFRYAIQLLPGAVVRKSSQDGIETIVIENGPIAARTERLGYVPADAVAEPQIEFATGTSWQQVAAEYARLSQDKLRVADVQPLLAHVNWKSGSRAEIARRLVSALHKSVRYTGVEFGESSLMPQFPSETLKRKYGDCKDKATVLVAMLRAAGIPASLALLDTGPGPDINTEMPGLGMFDHAIVYLPPFRQEPEMWIDATAQYTQVGYLPMMDYGRWSLVVDEKTTTLKKIPDLTSAQNLHREKREFTMAEFGQAKIVETDEQIGPREADYRSFYNGDSKEARENSENYVKNMYLADSLISLDHGDLTDMEKPVSIVFVTKGRRGSTDLTSATMAIRQESIFDGFPKYFYTKEEQPGNGADQEKPRPRTVDWWIPPFATEWDYKITVPVGFKLRALPPDKEQEFGSARYSQKYTARQDGTVVEAVFRFDSGKPRLTPAEARELRDRLIKAREADPIFISFDQIGAALLAAGRIREALAADRQLVALHPKEALHRIQLSSVFLAAGLGERARNSAREATLLEPNSAQAFSTLGWVLEHDLIGRRFKKGFDYEGALTAYRKAKQLDSKDKEIRANLGYLLEFDADGTRYGEHAHLSEAVSEFKDLKKVDEDYARKYENNILYDLWYAQKFDEVSAYAATLPATEARNSFVLAAIAAEQGTEAAVKKSLAITTDEQTRGKVLVDAGIFLMRIGRYAAASEMLAAGARNQSTGSQLATLVDMLKKTRPARDLKNDPSDPSSAVQRLFGLVLVAHPSLDQVKSIMSRHVPSPSDSSEEEQDFRRAFSGMRIQLASGGLPLPVIKDMVLSNVRYSKEGNDALGYRITMEAPAAQAQDVFVTRDDGEYRIAEFMTAARAVPQLMGWEVLVRLDHKDLAGARKWLDWVRDKVHINTGDDPLSGQPFPHFWTVGQNGDESAMRTAALVLLPSKELKPENFKGLIQARDQAPLGAQRTLLNLVLAYGYSAQGKWPELVAIAEELVKAEPDSLIAFELAAQGYANTRKFDEWDKLLQNRLQKRPDDPGYVRSAVSLALYRGDVDKSRTLLKGLMDRGKATPSDLNSYAWDALMPPGRVDQDAIDAARRANELTRNGTFAIMHTLACLYADAGKVAQAREVLLKAMDAAGMEEPDSEVWFAYGKIAEQYGEADAAQAMYARVKKPKLDSPGSSYHLAQQRLLALKGAPAATASTAGH